GAETRDILRLVIDQGMRPVIVGLVVGLAAALALGRLIASQLYQTSPANPLMLTATVTVLAFAALLACVIPARRASLVSPVDALPAECRSRSRPASKPGYSRFSRASSHCRRYRPAPSATRVIR